MKTQRYRQQHEDILATAAIISDKLNHEAISQDANEIRMLLSNLIGKLQYHLAIEDKFVYPNLLAYKEPKVVSTAQEFINEMGGIMKSIETYKLKWSNAHKIEAEPVDFISETQTILDKLIQRTEKENNELYKIVDELKN